MINVLSSVPTQDSDGHYIDDPIYIQFDQEIEASHLVDTYFKVWRCNADQTAFYDQLALVITKDTVDPRIVCLRPLGPFQPDMYYIVVVTGEEEGIASVGGDYLGSNFTLFFESGSTVRPAGTSVTSAGIDGIDIFVDGSQGLRSSANAGSYQRPSSDVFTASGETAPIALVRTIPGDRSVGVRSLSNMIFYYNDIVASGVPTNALIGRYRDLPVDMDPFADHTIRASGIVTAGNSVAFNIENDMADTTNREFVFTLASYKVRGTSRRAYDTVQHTVRFMGPLSPLYATPDQVSLRLKAFNTDAVIGVSDYELYKLIHEKSTWITEVMGITMTPANRMQINRLVICMVLLEMVNLGLLLTGGGIKSRTLILTSVVYESYKPSDMAAPLQACINNTTNELGGDYVTVLTGIKSGSALGREGKTYGVYR